MRIHISAMILAIGAFTSMSAASESPIGIIVALEPHEERLIDQLTDRATTRQASRTFTRGKLAGQLIVVVRSSMGPVDTAVTATVLVSKFTPRAILSIAPAGALQPRLSIGDVVVVERAREHDVGTWTDGGFAHRPQRAIPLDRGLLTRADSLESSMVRVTAATGNQFVASEATRTRLRDDLEADIVDTSSAAIATVASDTHTPALLLRVITDKATPDARISFDEVVEDEEILHHTIQLLRNVIRTVSVTP